MSEMDDVRRAKGREKLNWTANAAVAGRLASAKIMNETEPKMNEQEWMNYNEYGMEHPFYDGRGVLWPAMHVCAQGGVCLCDFNFCPIDFFALQKTINVPMQNYGWHLYALLNLIAS